MPPLPFDPYNFWSRENNPVRQARRSAPFVTIVYHPHRGAWKATWTDKVDLLGRLNGTREEVIAWARERCDDILYADPDDTTAPMVPLEPDDE